MTNVMTKAEAAWGHKPGGQDFLQATDKEAEAHPGAHWEQQELGLHLPVCSARLPSNRLMAALSCGKPPSLETQAQFSTPVWLSLTHTSRTVGHVSTS